jgi:hypothetical protein
MANDPFCLLMIVLNGSTGEHWVPSGNGGGVGDRSCSARLGSLEAQAFENLCAGSFGIGASCSESCSSLLLAQANSDMVWKSVIAVPSRATSYSRSGKKNAL